jgi:hypothetical protein
MNQALQRLPRAEEEALIALAVSYGLDRATLACHMTRQQGHGRGKGPEGSFTPVFNISYNLMLCEYCGNLEPSEVCPAKVRVIKERLLNG